MISDEMMLNCCHFAKSNSNRLKKFEIDHPDLHIYSRKFCHSNVLILVYLNCRSTANRSSMSFLTSERRFVERIVYLKCNKKVINDSSYDMEVVHPQSQISLSFFCIG
jgi:hypothetical protein